MLLNREGDFLRAENSCKNINDPKADVKYIKWNIFGIERFRKSTLMLNFAKDLDLAKITFLLKISTDYKNN